MKSSIFLPSVSIGINKIIIKFLYTESDPINTNQTIYVVGNGWASYHFVKNIDKKKFTPVVIAPNSRVLDTPKLISRILDPSISVEFDNPYIDKYIQGNVIDIDPESKKLILDTGSEINYNKVVFAIGSEPNDYDIQGVSTHTLKLKTISDIDLIGERISRIKPDSKIYIIGSGVTGIELSSKLAQTENPIKVIEGLDNILPGYSLNTKSHIKNLFYSKYPNISFGLNQSVKKIYKRDIKDSYFLMLKTFNSKNNVIQTTFLNPHDIIIWTGGVRFCGYGKTKLFSSLNHITPIRPRGLDSNSDFTIGTNPDIYCIGDMVANSGPPTAQNARLQAKWLAQYFNSGFDKKYLETNKFNPDSIVKLIHLNSHTWLESKYYTGPIHKYVDGIIGWFSK